MSIFKMTGRGIVASVAAIAFGMSLALPAMAQTLDGIKSKGKVVIGVQAENPNWGFMNSKGEFEGIDPDVARLLGQELGVPVEFVAVTNNNRIAALQTGRVDALIASVGMLPERAQAVQFSQPYAPNETIVVAPKSASLSKIDGLAKLKVGVPRGSIMDTQISKGAPAGTDILRLDDDSATIQALLSGQVQAVGANLFYVSRLNQQNPGVYEKKFVLAALYQGIATRLGDKTWNAYVNGFIQKNQANGNFSRIYKRWTGMEMTALPASIPGVPFTVQ